MNFEYEKGKNLLKEQKIKEAITVFEESTDEKSRFKLCVLLFQLKDITKDKKVFEICKVINNQKSNSLLGYMYLNGRGTVKNIEIGKKLIETNINSSYSKSFLGWMYHYGIGVE